MAMTLEDMNSCDDSQSDSQSHSEASSSRSRSISKLLDDAEAPISSASQKIRLSRSARRRTLAPIYNHMNSVSLESEGQKIIADCHEGGDRNKKDTILTQMVQTDNSKTKRSSDVAEINSDVQEIDAKEQVAETNKINVDKASRSDTMSTPRKSKRLRRSQRRRSFAIQNGSLLLGPSSTATMQTMSSLSGTSNSESSPFSAENFLNVEPSAPDNRITLVSASYESLNKSTNNEVENDNKLEIHMDASDEDDNDSRSKSTSESKSACSTLSSLCNGVEAMMDNIADNNNKKTKTKKKTNKKKKQAARKIQPTRRSARIRRSTMLLKVAPETEKEQEYWDNDPNDAHEPDVTRIVATFRLSTYSPLQGKHKCSLQGGIERIVNGKHGAAHDDKSEEKELSVVKKTPFLNPMDIISNKIHIEDDADCDRESKVHSDSKNARTRNTRTGPKAKRRRRSSLGLHVGGMISSKDIEALQKETAAARRRRKSIRDVKRGSVPLCSIEDDHDEDMTLVGKKNERDIKPMDVDTPCTSGDSVTDQNKIMPQDEIEIVDESSPAFSQRTNHPAASVSEESEQTSLREEEDKGKQSLLQNVTKQSGCDQNQVDDIVETTDVAMTLMKEGTDGQDKQEYSLPQHITTQSDFDQNPSREADDIVETADFAMTLLKVENDEQERDEHSLPQNITKESDCDKKSGEMHDIDVTIDIKMASPKVGNDEQEKEDCSPSQNITKESDCDQNLCGEMHGIDEITDTEMTSSKERNDLHSIKEHSSSQNITKQSDCDQKPSREIHEIDEVTDTTMTTSNKANDGHDNGNNRQYYLGPQDIFTQSNSEESPCSESFHDEKHFANEVLAQDEILIREEQPAGLDVQVTTVRNVADPEEKSKKTPHFNVTACEIKAVMKTCFQDAHGKNASKPCMAARLFSCAILRLKSDGFEFNQVEPLLSLLRAYVDVELASLEELNGTTKSRRIKKLHFCSFDLSTTINPIDTVVKSNQIIENIIGKLRLIEQNVKDFSTDLNSNGIVHSIEAFVRAMLAIEDEVDKISYVECCKAMPFQWPAKRFSLASKQYREELFHVCSRLNKHSLKISKSFIRRNLGDFIGRAIRFYLRRYFNPVPLPLHSDSDNLPDYSSSRSRVHEIVEMQDEDSEGRDTATADGSISSVIGIALQRILQFYELNSDILARRKSLNIKSDGCYVRSFCNRPATLRGLQERGCVIELSEENVHDIMQDIEESHIFLAGIRACKFIYSLLTWPGVSKAIDEVGGWKKIEVLASTFQNCSLSCEMPAERHFILLGDVNALLKKIHKEADNLSAVEEECEDSLRKVWRKFRCGTRNKELVELNPCIRIFQKEMKEGSRQTKFPRIVEATEWE